MNNITSSKFQFNFFGTKEIDCESPYTFVNVDFYDEILVNGESFSAVWQTGLSYYQNDYDQPKNCLELSEEQTHPALLKVVSLNEDDFKNMSEQDIVSYVDCEQFKIEEIKELFSLLKEQKEEVNRLLKQTDWENETPVF